MALLTKWHLWAEEKCFGQVVPLWHCCKEPFVEPLFLSVNCPQTFDWESETDREEKE